VTSWRQNSFKKRKETEKKEKKQLQNSLSPACVAAGWDKKNNADESINFLNDFVTRF